MTIPLFFSDAFSIGDDKLISYGTFNISLINDLPLFIDPFLLFNSDKDEYKKLHQDIIKYLIYLKKIAQSGPVPRGIEHDLFRFPEIKENWMGFSLDGNKGRGLGQKFSKSIIGGFNGAIRNFGSEEITQSSHLEKICLLQPGVGKDFISDFTLNMCLGYIAEYTARFAKNNLSNSQCGEFSLRRSRFNYETGTWVVKKYYLPKYKGVHVLLCPSDILTKDAAWINSKDLFGNFDNVIEALPNEVLRDQVNEYFKNQLANYEKLTQEDYAKEVSSTLEKWPIVYDYYIKGKEDDGGQATSIAREKVAFVDSIFVKNVAGLVNNYLNVPKYTKESNTYDEAMGRLIFLKDVIEKKGGHRFFWMGDKCVDRESDLQILYRLTWLGTLSKISREVNDGRGPVDFEVSRGSMDATLVEFKLAKNSKLKQNLQNQTTIYEGASDPTHPSIKAVFYFTESELGRVRGIIKELKLESDKNIVLIDARNDNKPSGSNAA